MQKKRYFHAAAAVKQTATICANAFNNCNTHYNDKFHETVKLLPKSVTGFQKSAKQPKSILVAVQDLKIFGIDLFLNISNLAIPLNFIYPKIGITNLDEHT